MITRHGGETTHAGGAEKTLIAVKGGRAEPSRLAINDYHLPGTRQTPHITTPIYGGTTSREHKLGAMIGTGRLPRGGHLGVETGEVSAVEDAASRMRGLGS